jgi:hypothetical protein
MAIEYFCLQNRKLYRIVIRKLQLRSGTQKIQTVKAHASHRNVGALCAKKSRFFRLFLVGV